MVFKLVLLCLFLLSDGYYVKTYDLPDLTDTTPKEFPYHAVIHAKIVCDGILISENYVITPAYCVYGASSVTVYLGFSGYPYYTSHHNEDHTQICRSSNIFLHEDFARLKDHHYLNNIAVIKLATPAILSDKVRPGKLISKDETQLLEGRFVNISGWLVSQDANIKFATVQLRNQDTCSYLFGTQYLRSQELCVKWGTKTRLNLLGNAVRVDDKIIGFQTNTPQCTVASSSCTRNDMILNFIPFLDWISHKIGVPVIEFTSTSQASIDHISLKKLEDLHNIIKEAKTKYDHDLANINKKIDDILSEFQNSKTGQNDYALTLNEQIGDIKSEINNSKTREDQNILKLQEELNGVRTELTNGLTAQRNSNNWETKFEELSNNIQSNINDRLNRVDKQFEELNNKIENNQIAENQKFLQQKQDMTILQGNFNAFDVRVNARQLIVDQQFEYVNTTIEEVLTTQNKLHILVGDIQTASKIHIAKEHESVINLKESLDNIVNTVQENKHKGNARFDNIEALFTEQRHDMEKHINLEFAEIHNLWGKVKLLNASVHRILDFVDDDPVPK